MSNIIPFGSGALAGVPAHIREALARRDGPLSKLSFSVGYPIVSIKGKVFTLKEGEEKKLITKPGTDEPASSLEVVILDAGPSYDLKLNSRIFYLKEYEEGSSEKPDCYSEDGEKPGSDAVHPQAAKCAICPHNAKGTSKTGKGKRCSSSKRLAIAAPDNLDKPFLLRVPGDSLMAFNEYLHWLHKSGCDKPEYVVTRIGFDYTVSHPALTFKALGIYAGQQNPEEAKNAEAVKYITGKVELPAAPAEEAFEQAADTSAEDAAAAAEAEAAAAALAEAEALAATAAAAAAAAVAAKAKAEAARAAKAKVAKTEKPADDLPTEPKVKTTIQVEETSEPPVIPADSALDSALDDLNFDD